MEARSLEFVTRACEGELMGGSPETVVRRVSTDSRKASAGDLFVAIKGDRFDGHEYIGDVAAKGAAAAVVEHGRVENASLPLIRVDDTRKALGRLGARYRQDFQIPVVAVAGSNGKTTTKELIAAVLQQKFPIVWSEASFNNDIGVPMTLLNLESKHEAAVLEVGTNHPGEIPALVRLIQPTLGVITSIGREHLEFFGDIEGVVEEEGWLAELLPASGTLFLNADNVWTKRIAERARASVVKIGAGVESDWRGEFRSMDASGVRFRVRAPRVDFSGDYEIRLLGRHQITNAIFAIAVGAELGATPEQVRRGLAQAQPPKMRMQFWEAGGIRVLDDSYNANADSVLAALQVLADLPCEGRRVAVLGDMAELGGHAIEAHREIGHRAAELGLDALVVVGKFATHTAEAATKAGLRDVITYNEVGGAAGSVPGFLKDGDLVLLKASRSVGIERVAEQLRVSGLK